MWDSPEIALTFLFLFLIYLVKLWGMNNPFSLSVSPAKTSHEERQGRGGVRSGEAQLRRWNIYLTQKRVLRTLQGWNVKSSHRETTESSEFWHDKAPLHTMCLTSNSYHLLHHRLRQFQFLFLVFGKFNCLFYFDFLLFLYFSTLFIK